VVAIGVLRDSQNSDAFRGGLVPLLQGPPLMQQQARNREFSFNAQQQLKQKGCQRRIAACGILDYRP
jgi:hypothetical protein